MARCVGAGVRVRCACASVCLYMMHACKMHVWGHVWTCCAIYLGAIEEVRGDSCVTVFDGCVFRLNCGLCVCICVGV